MFHLLYALLAPDDVVTNAPDMGWLGPVVTAIASVLVATIGGVSLAWRRRQDRRETLEDKAADAATAAQPKVTDGWEEVRRARQEASNYYNLYRAFENLYYIVLGALRHLARTVRLEHPDQKFDQDIVDALAAVPPDTTTVKK